MTSILHVKASPGHRTSHSEEAALALINRLRTGLPAASIDTIDVWNLALPEFDAAMIEAKFAVLRARDASEEQRRRWDQAVQISRRFNRADLYVFSLPMWNFGVPYRLKHFIDIVTLPGENWMWTREGGYVPLLRDKRAVLVVSSANRYDDDAAVGAPQSDFQRPFMRRWLQFIGVDVVKEICVSPTLTDPAQVATLKARARAEAERFAASLSTVAPTPA